SNDIPSGYGAAIHLNVEFVESSWANHVHFEVRKVRPLLLFYCASLSALKLDVCELVVFLLRRFLLNFPGYGRHNQVVLNIFWVDIVEYVVDVVAVAGCNL